MLDELVKDSAKFFLKTSLRKSALEHQEAVRESLRELEKSTGFNREDKLEVLRLQREVFDRSMAELIDEVKREG